MQYKEVKNFEIVYPNDEITITKFDWKYRFDPPEMVDNNDPNCIYKKVFKINLYTKTHLIDEYWYLSLENIKDSNSRSLYYKDVLCNQKTNSQYTYYNLNQLYKIIEALAQDHFGE